MNLVQTYALLDDPTAEKKEGAVRINRAEAESWNKRGYGIFHTVNCFFLNRKKENLREINAWYVDIDTGDKKEMWDKLMSALIPTMIVETKKGYHAYWKAKDGTVENWRQIMENRLIPFFNADKKAKDTARLLRTPGFFHMKDPKDPFLIKKVHYKHVEYSEREMFIYFKDVVSEKKQKKLHKAIIKQLPLKGSFWDKVWNLNCEYALSKISGDDIVKGEVFSFRENSNGTKNIYVNGKSTSCWIDLDGRIGSCDSGGPTIAAWIHWYGHQYTIVVDFLKNKFPELNDKEVEGQISLL